MAEGPRAFAARASGGDPDPWPTLRGSSEPDHHAALRSQIIRSASSIPSNIVEGREQKTDPAFARYLRFSISSASELEYHLLEAKEMRVVGDAEHLSLSTQVVEVRMMLHGLIRRLEGGDSDPGS